MTKLNAIRAAVQSHEFRVKFKILRHFKVKKGQKT